jgi:hypothetical protein
MTSDKVQYWRLEAIRTGLAVSLPISRVSSTLTERSHWPSMDFGAPGLNSSGSVHCRKNGEGQSRNHDYYTLTNYVASCLKESGIAKMKHTNSPS